MIRSSTNHRWHKLDELTQDGSPIEILAASCDDGIGVFARWTREPHGWKVEALDTEGQEWRDVTTFDEGECVPPEPPAEWDDLTSSSIAANLPDHQEAFDAQVAADVAYDKMVEYWTTSDRDNDHFRELISASDQARNHARSLRDALRGSLPPSPIKDTAGTSESETAVETAPPADPSSSSVDVAGTGSAGSEPCPSGR